MEKKRFLLAILIVIILSLASSAVFAGCCKGIVGCSRAFFESECSALASFDTQECEDITDCDVVACCHNLPGIPKATYRVTCAAMTPTPSLTYLKPFTTNPSSESAYANTICSGARPPCQNVSCQGPNSVSCLCGSTATRSDALYCCARDNSVFSTFGSCSASPSCRSGNFFSLHGRVIDPNGRGIAGAEVWGPSASHIITDAYGNYSFDLVVGDSRGTVWARMNSSINSTDFTMPGRDLFGVDIVLLVSALPLSGVESCLQGIIDGIDDDGDQFRWNSSPANTADICDSDCGTVKHTVTLTYYNLNGEYYRDTQGKIHDLCSDRFDNDCNGMADCEELACRDNSPSCRQTFCGDATIQFPNANGQYEQCDYYNATTGQPIVNATGGPIGNDSLCPGRCRPPSDPKGCTCRYEASCGNGVVDEPLEDCDGIFLAARNQWSAVDFKKSANYPGACDFSTCGKPTDKNPCQCPPPQLCGNGKKEGPEQCDPGDPTARPIVKDDSACKNLCNPDCTCPPKEYVCGNNLLEPGEDCDGTVNDDGNAWAEFKTRKYGCTRNLCAVPEMSPPASYIAPGGPFDDYSLYLVALKTHGNCSCQTNCSQSPSGPDVFSVKSVKFRKEINITWTDDCATENAKAYNVFRCKAKDNNGTGCKADGSEYTIVNSAPLPVGTPRYIDTTFTPSTFEEPRYYCYYVQGVYGNMISQDNVVPSDFTDFLDRKGFLPEIQCIKAGDAQCFSFKEMYPWAEEFCGLENYNVRSTCDDNNTVVMVADTTKKVDCNIADPAPGGKFTEYMCVGPFEETHPSNPRKTECIAKAICDYCNDPFGIFGYSSARSPGQRWEDAQTISTTEVGRAPRRPGLIRAQYTSCLSLDFCYMDYAYTNVNKFYSHKQNESCYDFNSLKACMEFNSTNHHCEWVWHPLYSELGIGVCRSDIVDAQECDRCHDPFNKVFGKCDRETCALYGRCYYDKANLEEDFYSFPILAKMTADHPVLRAEKIGLNYYKCTNERDITCENYDSKEDCINSSSPYSISGQERKASGVLLDVFGFMESKSAFKKQRGTNRIVNLSDDFFGFGKCAWPYYIRNSSYIDPVNGSWMVETEVEEEHACMKNSDGSPYHIEVDSPSDLINDTYYTQHSDCGGAPFLAGEDNYPLLELFRENNIKYCRKDFSSPTTNIPHFEDIVNPMRISGAFRLSAVVSDNSLDLDYTNYYPDTYACVGYVNVTSNKVYTCYPNGTADKLGLALGNLVTSRNVGYNVSYNFSESGFQTGRHILWYFSEDVSHNLEEVRNFTVFIDANPPNMVLDFSNISYEIYEDEWRTNVTVLMRVVPVKQFDDTNAFCSAKLYLNNATIYSAENIDRVYGNTWRLNYSALVDSIYRLWYYCEDDVGNYVEKNVTFRVEGDRSITNPLPIGTVNSTSVTLSVETGTNAECRYMPSVGDDPGYLPNATFDETFFNRMIHFTLTGSVPTPSTIHRQITSASEGYNRYYIKCKSLKDSKIRGNDADQIRFAVDMTPPVSTITADLIPYDGWYNRNIHVSISCGDPSILGMGLDWSFGCRNSYYCVGLDCSDRPVKIQNYTEPVLLNATEYVSYYSVDNGNNVEQTVRNVLFQIDKTPPNVTIEFFEGDAVARVLVPTVVYRIVVNSSKPFISPAVRIPVLTYASQPAKFAGGIELLPTLDPAVWEGVFYIENMNANMGFEGDGVFSLSGFDYHNVSASGTRRIPIDTKPPEPPVLEPSLDEPSREGSDYQSLGYPVHYYNGTYYTSRASLFITGYTSEYLDLIRVISVDGVVDERPFHQEITNMTFDDKVISGFKDYHEIKVAGDITRRVDADMYIGFDEEQTTIGPKMVYGNYGMFYDINKVEYFGADKQYTSITVYPALEESLKLDRKLVFYNKENPSLWFGFDIPMVQFQNTSLYFKAYDSANNLVRYPEISAAEQFFVFFSDPVAPVVMSYFPDFSTTSNTDPLVYITVKEGKQESGIFREGINFTLNGESVDYSIEHDADLESADTSSYYYRISYQASGLEDREYIVSVAGSDLAMNMFDESGNPARFSFIVDRKAPAPPQVTFVDGFPGPPGDNRWYITHSPDFIVDFSIERDPVTIVDTFMEDSPTEGGAANCTNTSRNIYRCRFNSPKTATGSFWGDYGVNIVAFKTLADGTRSLDDRFGPFRFTVDDEPPDFTPAFRTRFMDNINLTIGTVITNERHPVFADLYFLGEHFAPLYSRNNGPFYYFTWAIPRYDKSKERNQTLTMTLSDFARNSRSVDIPVYLDLTAPRIENITIEVSSTVIIGSERFTAQPVVNVSGIFIDDDIEQVWIEPGDYNVTTGKTEAKAVGQIARHEDGTSKSFSVTVRLVDPNAGKIVTAPVPYRDMLNNEMLINQINNMKLYARDLAGHVRSIDLKVIRDIAAPKEPLFCLGADWSSCIPPLQ